MTCDILFTVIVKKTKIKHKFDKERQSARKNRFVKFMKRHKERAVRIPENASIQHAMSFSCPKVERFYDICQKTVFTESGDRKIPPQNVYNVAETGFSICHKPHTIIARKGKQSVGAPVSAEQGKHNFRALILTHWSLDGVMKISLLIVSNTL